MQATESLLDDLFIKAKELAQARHLEITQKGISFTIGYGTKEFLAYFKGEQLIAESTAAVYAGLEISSGGSVYIVKTVDVLQGHKILSVVNMNSRIEFFNTIERLGINKASTSYALKAISPPVPCVISGGTVTLLARPEAQVGAIVKLSGTTYRITTRKNEGLFCQIGLAPWSGLEV